MIPLSAACHHSSNLSETVGFHNLLLAELYLPGPDHQNHPVHRALLKGSQRMTDKRTSLQLQILLVDPAFPAARTMAAVSFPSFIIFSMSSPSLSAYFISCASVKQRRGGAYRSPNLRFGTAFRSHPLLAPLMYS
jgi:hypothetical protein